MVKIAHSSHVQFSQTLNDVPLGVGMLSIEAVKGELLGYTDIILGRVPSPITSPYLGLMECATAYYARAKEIEAAIHEKERTGEILRSSDWSRFRTGMLRSFIESMKLCAQSGSRRLTQEQLLHDLRLDAGEVD